MLTIFPNSVIMVSMLKIRLQRVGRKHEPVFRLVLTDSKNSAKSGKSLETLGSYDARRGHEATLKGDRIKYWMSQGAQASGTVHNLLISKKIIEGKKVNVLPLKTAIKKEVPAEEVKKETAQAEEPIEKSTEVVSDAPVSDVSEEVATSGSEEKVAE